MIIALSGAKRAGKDTTAEVLVKKHNFEAIAFADPLRELCSDIFSIPRSTFTDDNLKEKQFDETRYITNLDIGNIIEYLETNYKYTITDEQIVSMSKFVGSEIKNPRNLLQIVGTEIIRGCVDDKIFIKKVEERIKSCEKNVVITDARFSAERSFLRSLGATMVLIKRPDYPTFKDLHVSENELGSEDEYNVIITNNDTIYKLQSEVDIWYTLTVRR